MKFFSSSSGFLSIFVIAFTLICCFMLLAVGSASAESVSVVNQQFTYSGSSSQTVVNPPSSYLGDAYQRCYAGNGYAVFQPQDVSVFCTSNAFDSNAIITFSESTDLLYWHQYVYVYDIASGSYAMQTTNYDIPSGQVYMVFQLTYVYSRATMATIAQSLYNSVRNSLGNLPFYVTFGENFSGRYAVKVWIPLNNVVNGYSTTTTVPYSYTQTVSVTQDSNNGRYTLNIGKSGSSSSYRVFLLRQTRSTDGSIVDQGGVFYTQTGITSSSYSLSSCVPQGGSSTVYLESDVGRTSTFETEYYSYTLGLYDTTSNSLIGQLTWGSAFNPYVPVTPSAFDFGVHADLPSQTYTVYLDRHSNVMHLAITGKIFGWMSVYTYYEDRPTFDLVSNTHLTGLPIYWLGLGVDYEAQVFGEGGAYTGDNWRYSWNQDNYGLTPGVPSATPTPYQVPTVTFTPIMPHPTPIGSATPTPRVPAIGDPYYDTWTIFSVPGFDDEDYFSFEDFIEGLKTASLPGSLIEYFDIETPEEFKERTSVSSDSMFYDFQQSGFSLFESVLYLPCGVLFVLTSLVAYLPETVYGFFSELITFMSASFASFNSFVTIPSMILEKVVTLIPTPVMNLALLLFSVDLFFLFFRLVVPGIISGSRALGSMINYKKGDK